MTTHTGTRRIRTKVAAAGALLAATVALAPMAATTAAADPGTAAATTMGSTVTTQGRTIGLTTGGNMAADYYGQCTWGAYEKFHEATGLWPLIGGNAKDMDDNAAANGWTVVLDAEPRSLVVFDPGIHGSDLTYGHVAWVQDVYFENGVKMIHIIETNAGGALGQFTERRVPDVIGMSYVLAP